VKQSKVSSAASESVISAPVTEKKLTPKIRGQSDKTVAMQRSNFAMFSDFLFPVKQYTVSTAKITHVMTAVINGAKLAYPNGVKLK